MEEASVAGESPDRSKQHEASAEPASGSAGAVPAAREAGSAGSAKATTADSAAPVEDEELREAVSAWVRSAEDASGGSAKEKPSAEGESGTSAEGASGGSEEGDSPAEAAGGSAGSDEGASPANAESGSAGSAGSDESGSSTEAAGGSAGSDEGAASADAGEGSEGSDASDASDEGGSPANAGGASGGSDEGTASADAGEGSEDSDASDASDEGGSPANTGDASGGSDAGTASAHAGDGSDGSDEGGSPAGDRDGADPVKAGDSSNGSGAEGSADDAEDAPEEGSGTGDAKAAEGASKAVPDDTFKKSGADGAPDATDAPEGASEGSGEDSPREDPEGAPEGTSGSAEDSEEGDAEPADEPAAGNDTEDEAEDSSKGTPLPAAKGDAEPAGDVPERPGKDAPEAGAEDSPEDATTPADAVDNPTTVFKAPRPKKPEVDQPTTMLKLGGKPKPAPAERDAERTSRFVALKPDLKGPSAKAEETRVVPQVGPERTTQQPLPPKPPLDLLAELTNTPPPPETPVRTLMRRVKIWTPLVILLVVILGVVQATRPLPQPSLALTAKDSYTFEGGKADIPWPADGQAALDVQGIGSFGSSGSGKPVPIASVAKVMTAYLILRDHPLKSGAEGPKINIDKTAQAQSKAGQESTVDVTEGDKITQREALEGVLIASANNVARLLARWDAGSEKAFVAKMNEAAEGLGMDGTTYTDPSGLTNSTVSTASDQVKLAKAAMEMPAFREVAAMMSYTDYKGTYHSNWNQLVGHNGVVGIKTGTTTSALGNLVFAAKQDVDGETRMIIGAVLRQPPSKRDNSILSAAMDSSDALIRAAQGALKSETVLKKGTVVGYVDDGLGGQTPVEVTEDVKAAGWAGLKVRLSFTSSTIPHVAKAGTKVGSLTVGDGSAGAVKVPVALRDDLAEPGLGSKLTRIG
ncbi:D-alanyl-D-alanine carboxypeptidase [Streptomyces seoulensis]|uniref:D-alanyl-D-alanine carboxypeptidase n=1 Tax=Streptomyces seoulensis TaxID=73044 RepID=UPI001FCB981D|nr:D-alanyl-D-alanine carboxypeptidase [Streptomyces seoulensis]